MSARWPSTLLNSVNRQLAEQIERLTADLEVKAHHCAEQKTLVENLRKYCHHVQEETKRCGGLLETTKSAVEKAEGELKQLLPQLDGDTRRLRQLLEQADNLNSSVSSFEEALQQQRKVLLGCQEESILLEAEVKVIVSEHASRQRVGEDLTSAQEKLSSVIWARLEQLNSEVATRMELLERGRKEHERILLEVERMQKLVQAAVTDQAENVEAAQLVHQQTSVLDEQILANAQTMEVLRKEAQEKQSEVKRLHTLLTELRMFQQERKSACDIHRTKMNQRTAAFQELHEALQQIETAIQGSKRRRAVEGQRLVQQHRQLQHLLSLFNDRGQVLEQERLHWRSMEGALKDLRREMDTGQPSLAALQDMLLSLSRQKSLLDDRVERTLGQLTSARQTFIDEGQRCEQINDAIAQKQSEYNALVDVAAMEGEKAKLLKASAEQLGALLSEREELLPQIRAIEAEQRSQKVAFLTREATRLREELGHAQREYRLLRQGTTALRSSVYRAAQSMGETDETQDTAEKAVRLLEIELTTLEAETKSIEKQRNLKRLQQDQSDVALSTLLKVAEAETGALKEVAGVESYLRAEVLMQEDSLEADMRGALLELHLHEKEVHELYDEQQRHVRKIELLRLRYEEVMAALARSVQRPMSGEGNEGSSFPRLEKLLGCAEQGGDQTSPEHLHACLVLQRSYEREQLMERGSYLDLRLVALDRETSALRHMLDALRASAGTSSVTNVRKAAVDSLAKAEVRREEPIIMKGHGTTSSSALQALNVMADHDYYLGVELKLLEEGLVSMSKQRSSVRSQLHQLHSVLRTLQDEVRRKTVESQRLADNLQRIRKGKCPGKRFAALPAPK